MGQRSGLPAYSNVYFATDQAITDNADILAAFIGAAAKGWGDVHANPAEAVQILVATTDGIDKEWELKTIDLILRLSFDAASLEEQVSQYNSIQQYPSGRPALEDVYTSSILEMSGAAKARRPCLMALAIETRQLALWLSRVDHRHHRAEQR